MTWVTKPCPKPPPPKKLRGGKCGASTGRPRLKNRNAKRKGSAFPKVRDPEFCRWVVTLPCVGRGLLFIHRVSMHDTDFYGLWRHRCWGENTPAHIGKHRAQGVGDRGRVVSMCQALHDHYDTQRGKCLESLSAHTLTAIARDLQQRWVERGGAP